MNLLRCRPTDHCSRRERRRTSACSILAVFAAAAAVTASCSEPTTEGTTWPCPAAASEKAGTSGCEPTYARHSRQSGLRHTVPATASS